MKKILSILIAIFMLASAFAIFSIPAAAADNAWVVYGHANDYREDFNEEYGDEYSNVPGYEYIYGEGLKTISPNWETTSPKLGVQTGEKVNLKDGVYMLVRIDEFSYEAGDKWFAFSISDTQYVNVSSNSIEQDGQRVVALIRSGADTMSQVEWWNQNYQWGGWSNMTYADNQKFDEEGRALLELVVTWDELNSTYSVTVNGAKIDNASLAWMNRHFANGEAYIGINAQNSQKGGEAGLTVLKFGESKDTAITPFYADRQEPVNVEGRYVNAPIADASTVPLDQPAIIMNGSRNESDSKTTVKNDGIYSLTEENYKHVAADRADMEISFSVKNSVSYAIEDFPVALILTRNLCTCTADCWAFEETDIYLMAGDDIAASKNRQVAQISPSSGDYAIECEDGNYLFFTVNFAEEAKTADATGRINGIRFDVNKIVIKTPGRNEFDVCFVAFFRTEDEAKSYAYEFLGLNHLGHPKGYDDGLAAGYDVGYEAGYADGFDGKISNCTLSKLELTADADWYDKGFVKGYNEKLQIGYNEGYSKGRNDKNTLYNSGYDEGYEVGYALGSTHGYSDGLNGKDKNCTLSKIEPSTDAGWHDKGYAEGYNKGLQDGYNAGYTLGLNKRTELYNEGYAAGASAGAVEGQENGIKDGVAGAYKESFTVKEPADNSSYQQGYADGYNAQFTLAYEAGFKQGKLVHDGLQSAKTELQNKIDTKADAATVNTAIENLQNAIDVLEGVKDNYLTADATLKSELEKEIEDARSSAISAAETLVNNAKTDLQNKIDTKADAATVNTAIENLQNAIAMLEGVKDNYLTADATLKSELEKEIEDAKSSAISAAETLVNNAKAELQNKIDTKADATAVYTAIAGLQSAINTLNSVKNDYTSADSALKTELEKEIEDAKSSAISAAETLVSNAKTELQNKIDTKADTDTVNAAIAELQAAIDALKNSYEEGRAAGYDEGYEAAKQELESNNASISPDSLPGCQGTVGSETIILIFLIFPAALLTFKRKKDE